MFQSVVRRALPILLASPQRVLTALMITGAVGYGAGMNTPLRPLVPLTYPVLFLLGLLALYIRAIREPRHRWGWATLATGLSCAVPGSIYLAIALSKDPVRHWPSWADLGRVGFLLFGISSLIVMMQGRLQRHRTSMLLDVVSCALLVGAAALAFLQRSASLHGATALERAARLLYPVGDVMLVSTTLAGLALLGRRPDRPLGLCLAAIPILAVGDIFNVRYPAAAMLGVPLADLLQLSSLIMVCVAACMQDPSDVAQGSRGGAQGVIDALFPVVVGCSALLLLTPALDGRVGQWARWCAVLSLLVAALRMVVTAREVSRLIQERDQSHIDYLTGLMNRSGMVAHLDEVFTMLQDASSNESVAVMLLDIDQFKEVNDALGHDRGDAVVKTLGNRLVSILDSPGTRVARMGGDEFAILLRSVDAQGARLATEQIIDALHEPVELDDVTLEVDVSIGVTVVNPAQAQMTDVLRWSDIALYRAKTTPGSSYNVHNPADPDDAHAERLRLLVDLRVALAPGNDGRRGHMVVFYQPKIDLGTGEVKGSEALVRWQHPESGLIFPDTFLPIAAEAGLLHRVTEVVLHQALEQVSSWRAQGHDLGVAVNLPAAAIVDAELPNRISAALDAAGVPPQALVLEITEESLLGDRVRARSVLARLRALGVAMSIDDYGTGYSSLAYLRELPVDELKLDRSFIQPMADDERAAAIVRSTVDLAHSLGLRIVAEGVEDEQAAVQLRSYGCDDVQGYHYSRPIPAAQFEEWLGQRPEPAKMPTQRQGQELEPA